MGVLQMNYEHLRSLFNAVEANEKWEMALVVAPRLRDELDRITSEQIQQKALDDLTPKPKPVKECSSCHGKPCKKHQTTEYSCNRCCSECNNTGNKLSHAEKERLHELFKKDVLQKDLNLKQTRSLFGEVEAKEYWNGVIFVASRI